MVLAPHDEYGSDVWQFVNPGYTDGFYAETRTMLGRTFDSVRAEAESLIKAATGGERSGG